MSHLYQSLCMAALLAAVALFAPGAAQAQSTDRLIVKYRSTSEAFLKPSFQTMAPLHAIANRAGLQLRFLRTTRNKAHVLAMDRFSDTQTLKTLAAFIKTALPAEIEFAEPDHLAQPAMTPNDAGFLTQWNLSGSVFGISAAAAWDLSTGAAFDDLAHQRVGHHVFHPPTHKVVFCMAQRGREAHDAVLAIHHHGAHGGAGEGVEHALRGELEHAFGVERGG